MVHANNSTTQPIPYCGEELERLEGLGEPQFRRAFGNDRSGRRLYKFNQLGYRGKEFAPHASHQIFVFGESHAFGYFVDFDQCWPSRFVELWSRHLGIEHNEIGYLNFADPGTSNASIARSVVSQCSAVRPDLVLVHFANLLRSELILDGRPHRVGHWLLQEKEKLVAQETRPGGAVPKTLMELIDRGSSYYRFAQGSERMKELEEPVDATCLLENLRSLLLVQFFCKSEGIPLVATCEHIDPLLARGIQKDPTLGPLVRCLDPEVFTNFGIWCVPGDHSEDPGHAGPSRHNRFARAMFDFYRQRPPAASSHRPREEAPQAAVEDSVQTFYQQLPFNHFGNPRTAARSLRTNPIPETYPDAHRLLETGAISTAVDCGCGAGWLSNTLALHYEVEVTGVDFTVRALERAQEVAHRLGVHHRVRFVEADLLELVCHQSFDLVCSLGVLHHTPDPRRAFHRIQHLARPGGHIYLGLYHQPGRAPFLEHFHRIVEQEGEVAAFEAFRDLQPEPQDEEHLRSWFRDQVLHPRESQHTLREVTEWLVADGLELVSTSINRFQPFESLDSLFEMEAAYEARSQQALRQLRFFPGFFTLLARRPE